MVQVIVRGDGSIEMSSWVTESSQPEAGVVSAVVPVLAQVIDVALVSPEPPSRKLTWMSASGVLVNVTTPAPVGWLSVQFVPVTTVAVRFDWEAPPYPGGGDVSLTV
jgi:hypothetical protein